MKYIVNSNISYKGELSNRLYAFCWKHCKHIILTQRTKRVADAVQLQDAVCSAVCEIEKRRERQLAHVKKATLQEIKEDGFRNKSQIEALIKETAEEDIATAKSYLHHHQKGTVSLQQDLQPYGLEKLSVMIGSFVTFPGIWNICFFNKSALELQSVKSDIYQTPICVGNYSFEDIAFDNESGHVWMKACAHEEFFQMELTDELYEEFLTYEIPHEIMMDI